MQKSVDESRFFAQSLDMKNEDMNTKITEAEAIEIRLAIEDMGLMKAVEKFEEAEAIEIRLAMEDRINIINKQIRECSYMNMKECVNYWQDKLQKAQSAHKKLKYSVLFMAGE